MGITVYIRGNVYSWDFEQKPELVYMFFRVVGIVSDVVRVCVCVLMYVSSCVKINTKSAHILYSLANSEDIIM